MNNIPDVATHPFAHLIASPLTFIPFDQLPPRQFLCPKLSIERGSLCSIVGTGFAGKSVFAQHLAVSISFGLPLFQTEEYNCVSGKVLHIDLEQHIEQTTRIYQRLCNGVNVNPNDLNVTRIVLPTTIDNPLFNVEESFKYLLQLFTGYDLVLIDSLRRSTSQEENSSKISETLTIYQRLAQQAKCTVAFIHHKGKGDSSTSSQSGRGSSAIYDAVDVQVDLDRFSLTEIGKTKMKSAKDRLGLGFDPLVYEMISDGTFYPEQRLYHNLKLQLLSEDSDAFNQSINLKVINYLHANHCASIPINQTKLREMIRVQTGWSHDKVLEKIAQLENNNTINSVSGLKNAKNYQVGTEGEALLQYNVTADGNIDG